MVYKFSDTCLHFVCLVRHLETVIATPIVQAEPRDSCLRFPSTLKLQDLFSDFKVTIEVYSLQTRAEILPHEIKYHIHNSGSNCSSSNHKKVYILLEFKQYKYILHKTDYVKLDFGCFFLSV